VGLKSEPRPRTAKAISVWSRWVTPANDFSLVKRRKSWSWPGGGEIGASQHSRDFSAEQIDVSGQRSHIAKAHNIRDLQNVPVTFGTFLDETFPVLPLPAARVYHDNAREAKIHDAS
jgi:hypothetical protein